MVDGKNCYHKIGNYSKTEKSESSSFAKGHFHYVLLFGK